MDMRDHQLHLNGLRRSSTLPAVAYDEHHAEIWRGEVTAGDCYAYCCPDYWSNFQLADYLTKIVPGIRWASYAAGPVRF